MYLSSTVAPALVPHVLAREAPESQRHDKLTRWKQSTPTSHSTVLDLLLIHTFSTILALPPSQKLGNCHCASALLSMFSQLLKLLIGGILAYVSGFSALGSPGFQHLCRAKVNARRGFTYTSSSNILSWIVLDFMHLPVDSPSSSSVPRTALLQALRLAAGLPVL